MAPAVFTPLREGVESRDPSTSVITSSIFLGLNWAAFASDLKEVGGFDPRFGPGSATGSTGQETAMQRRFLAAGLHGRDVPHAEVWHWIPRIGVQGAGRCIARIATGSDMACRPSYPPTPCACGATPAMRFEALPSRRSGRSCAASILAKRRDSKRDASG